MSNLKTSPIQLVVFDMAGTTVKDSNEVQGCFFAAAEATGLSAAPERIIAMMGWTKKLVFQTLWAEQIGLKHPDYPQNVEASYTKFKEVLENHYRTQPVEPTDGCLELFEWLKSQDIKIGLNTGFYREVTDIILERLGWYQDLDQNYVGSSSSIIQVSVTPSEIYQNEGRPAPYMIQKAMYKLGIKNSQQVITIGDTPADIEAGTNAGCCLSLGVTNGTHTREQLEQYAHDGLINSINELKARIESER
ncbi:MAG: HAD hydrolase-like protein [Oscillatoriales cyanobacterium RM2_1_1]|nr:HAD hydrolase-like protein [Oscillatoriales cyanobacterium SM2_3_0]NJO44399.1 HAD hydrolase-like protein [Oscillatoriales cyanobacterium RM2_1_1]